MLLVICHGHNLTLDAVTIKSSTSDDRNDAEHVTGCPQIILEDGGKTQIALVAAACLNKQQRVLCLSLPIAASQHPLPETLGCPCKDTRNEADEQGERMTQLPHHWAQEPPLAAKGQSPVTCPQLPQMSGN